MKSAIASPSVGEHTRIVRQILTQRGYAQDTEVEDFLNPSYDQHLHDPFLLTDMEPAVERILKAVEGRQNIVIYGDYDIDGITASAVMLEVIAGLGGTATSYIPDRFEEGYGINLEALKTLKDGGTDLVVSVDCGITSVNEAKWAVKNGLDLIITDHHAVPEVIPEAVAVINPKRLQDKYPFKDLAGVGVAFKLAQALQIRSGKPEKGKEKWLLDLVALGTVCDVVTLVGENRVLAYYGLLVMTKTRRVGLKALAIVAGVELADLKSYHLGFMLGPRLNAAGRLEHAASSLELLTTDNAERATEIANQLDQLNLKRQKDQAKILAEANKQAEEFADDPILVLAAKDWSHGIVGIVASKLVERWRKPVLVMQILGKEAKGSSRSLGNFNLVEALRGVSDNFIKFGGHFFAAGFTLKADGIDKLRADLVKYCRKLKPAMVTESDLTIDAELGDLAVVDWPLYGELSRLEPFGSGNPKPRFLVHGIKVLSCRSVGQEQNHLQLSLGDVSGHQVKAIGFDLVRSCADIKVGSVVDAVFQISPNVFNGQTTLQLNIISLKPVASL